MKLVFIEKGRAVTDSLTIASTFGKRHDAVMRDIRDILEKLMMEVPNKPELTEKNREFALHNFVETPYVNESNHQTYQKFVMTEESFNIVVMGFTGIDAMTYKVAYVNEFKRMKHELNKPQLNLPQTMPEALRLLAAQIEETEAVKAEKERLALESAEQQKKLQEQETPVAIYNLAINAKNTMTMQEAAKSLGTGRTRLYKILREEKIILQNINAPYQRYIEAGYFKVVERPRASGDTIVNDTATRVTAKGFDYIARLLKKRAEQNGQGA